MTWIRAGTDVSVRSLFLSSRNFNVLLVRTAAHRSLMQASVKPVISTLQKDYADIFFKKKQKNKNLLARCSPTSAELTRDPPADSLDVQLHPRDI